MFRFRDRKTSSKIIGILQTLNLNLNIMHICGTHQDTLVRFGLEPILNSCGINIRQGPGCPVCVTTAREYEEAIVLAKKGKVITTFGDAAKVPGLKSSLLDLRTEGYDVRIVYSITDALYFAKKSKKEIVFLGVGFETTAPSTASMMIKGLPENFSILCCHRYVPPVLKSLLKMGEFKIDGLIEPGHVSVILGIEKYNEISKIYKIPQVIAGFEPLDMLMAIYMLAIQIKNGKAEVENEYSRAVKYEGNLKALIALDEAFEPFDVDWRGFPVIPKSGMKMKKKFERYDARKKFEDDLVDLKSLDFKKNNMCRCGEILRGIIRPMDCILFGKGCSPNTPIGPCMVSVEGMCNIYYRHNFIKQ